MKGVIFGRDLAQRLQQRARVGFRCAKAPAQHIVMRQQPLDLGAAGWRDR